MDKQEVSPEPESVTDEDKGYVLKCLKIIENGDDEMIRKCQTGDVVESVYEELLLKN